MTMKSMLLAAVALAALQAGAARAQVTDDLLSESRGGFVTAGGLTFGLGVKITTYVDGSVALQSTVSYTGANPVPTGASTVTAPTLPTAPTGPTAPTLPTAPTAPTAPTIATLPTAPAVTAPSAPVVQPVAPVQVASPAATFQAPVVTPAIAPAPPAAPPSPTLVATTSPSPPGASVPTAPVAPAVVGDPPIPPTATQVVASGPAPTTAAAPSPVQPVDAPATTVVTVPPGALQQALVETRVAESEPVAPPGSVSTTTEDGLTTVIHTLTPGALRNLVVNSADNRVIQQDLQLDIVLPGFPEVQQQNLLSSIGMKIAADGGLGTIGALAR